MEDLLFKGKVFATQQLGGIEKTVKFKELMFVTKNTPLLQVIQRFCQEGQRRAAVIEPVSKSTTEEELQSLIASGNDRKLKMNEYKCINVIAHSDIGIFLAEVSNIPLVECISSDAILFE